MKYANPSLLGFGWNMMSYIHSDILDTITQLRYEGLSPWQSGLMHCEAIGSTTTTQVMLEVCVVNLPETG